MEFQLTRRQAIQGTVSLSALTVLPFQQVNAQVLEDTAPAVKFESYLDFRKRQMSERVLKA